MRPRCASSRLSAPRPTRVRVVGTGRLARLVWVPLGLFFGFALVMNMPMRTTDFWGQMLPWLLSVPVVFAGLRSLVLGVWMHDDRLVARTWFRRFEVRREALAGCVSEMYGGLLTKGSDTGWMRELEFVTSAGRSYSLGGTVALRARSEMQARQVRAYIDGVPAGETLVVAQEWWSGMKTRESGKHAGATRDG